MAKKLEFTVWQFVRVMVELERSRGKAGAAPRQSFYSRHRETWEELDRELEALNTAAGEADRARYARRMMKDTLVVRVQSPAHILEVAQALGRVVNQMSAEIRKAAPGADAAGRAHLQFEVRELKLLRDRFQWLHRRETSPDAD